MGMGDSIVQWLIALKWWLSGREFEPRPPRCRVSPYTSCSHPCTSVTKQLNLVLTDERWRSSARKVTGGLAESNVSLQPAGCLTKVTCGLTDCTPGSAPGPVLGNEYGRTCMVKINRIIITFSCWISGGSLFHEVLHLPYVF